MAKERRIQTRTLLALRRRWPKGKFINLHVDGYGNEGEPDIIGCIGGRAVVIEVKNSAGKLRPMQEVKLRQWLRAEAVTLVVRSAQEAVARIEEELDED